MKVDLPDKFVQKMKLLLEDEYEQFISSYDEVRYYGLRINELKINTQDWYEHSKMKASLSVVPWCQQAFYFNEEERPAKKPQYHAGLYYIQEPSAMVPVELLDVRPGCRILDLCAAPGGKSTQIASKLKGRGVLVSNDIATERTKPLSKNIEMAGVRNAIVLNEHPANIAQVFPEWFDRILIDAPCSGEGMFRKSPAMIDEWLDYSVERCSKMQKDILHEVARMLAPGGRMVYSTCTFSPEENEEQIAAFLAEHDDFTIVQVPHQWGWSQGNPAWVSEETAAKLSDEQLQSISGTVRLWPHRTKGEGHFIAVLERNGSGEMTENSSQYDGTLKVNWSSYNASAANEKGTAKYIKGAKPKDKHNYKSKHSYAEAGKHAADCDIQKLFEQFHKNNLNICGQDEMRAIVYGSRVYFQPIELPSLAGLKVVRAGWPIGECKAQKFIPYHSLAMALTPKEALRVISFDQDDEQLIRYLKGETIFIHEDQLQICDEASKNGYVLVCVEHFPVGFGKYIDGMIKNELPAGWRLI